MTFHAPLNQKISPVRSKFPARIARALAGAIAIITLTACATPQQPDASQADNEYWQQVQTSDLQQAVNTVVVEPASASGTATPGLMALGTGQQRKRALRALAARSIRQDNPGNYTVVKGDTLWDISERFLSRPWLWPEIWQVNPQIENPHLIYPGDRISLTYVDGQPRLQLVRASSKQTGAISNFPLEAVKEFLIEPNVVSAAEMQAAPYVVGTEDDRLIASIGNHIYARGSLTGSRYSIFRPGDTLIDPDTDEVLGHEAVHVSRASLIKAGDPSKLVITSNKRETLVGDRVMTAPNTSALDFQPRVAGIQKTGKIISLVDALYRAGQNQIVVLNLGTNDGVQPGDVLSVVSDDRIVRDTISGKKNDFVTIEGEKAGVVMVFRTFDKVSYALIMTSNRTINLYDRVGTGNL